MTQEEITLSKILFVEDDPNLSIILKDYLEMTGYQVDHAGDGVKGLQLYHKNKYDLLILDVMMPKKDGFTLAKEIRKNDSQVPIIFLTAKNLKEDRIKGFLSGCDDYITKPFNTKELSLRIKAILKRCETEKQSYAREYEIFNIGSFTFNASTMTLSGKGDDRKLTKKETALLKLLCENVNNLLTRETALEIVWGENDYFIGRSMDVFITKLRKYLKPDPNVKIANIHGIGFRLEISESVKKPEESIA
ncbi:MAG: response regulator transcription factor [Chlorobi bacterium]|nr:response regulator transcription factor [Chlorobiota bacterium]